MLVEVKVPTLSESVAEATLVDWHKKVGEFIEQDENLIDLETDKVVLEIAAPQAGVLKEIKKNAGANVVSDEVIALIDTEAVNDAKAVEKDAVESKEADYAGENQGQKVNPAAKKLMDENDIIPEAVQGTGKDKRITKADVVRYLDDRYQQQEPKEAAAVPANDQEAESVEPAIAYQREDKRVPMTRLRSRIAERLKQAQNTSAMLTTFNEVNMQPVMAIRARYKASFEKEKGVKLGYMSFFTKAAVDALKKFPIVNASVNNEEIIYHNYYDIGIAVSSPRGLVVPILRDADRKSFAEIEQKIKEFGAKAQDATLSMDELSGGTFTITNGGIFGSMLSTPILNPPQSAILGMHAINERPVAEQGQVVIRPVMYLALTYDHRIIDGKEAVQFLVHIKNALEDPTRLLLQV